MSEKVFLDTTIFSYLFDSRSELKEKIKITKEWWKNESHKYNLVTSNEVRFELEKGNYSFKNKATRLCDKIPKLERTSNVELIAKYYIKNFLMPNDLEGDAIHVAISSFHEVDFLLSWNISHLANHNKRKQIEVLNKKLGLKVPLIVTVYDIYKGWEKL